MKTTSTIAAGVLALSVGAVSTLGAAPAAQAETRHVPAPQVLDTRAGNPITDLAGKADQLTKLLAELIADAGFGPGANIPKEKLTSLIADAIAQKNPDIAPAVLRKSLAAFGDLATIGTKLNPAELAQLGAGAKMLAAAIASVATDGAAGKPPQAQSIIQIITGAGKTGTALLSLLIAGLHMYEASANVPQGADVLNLFDPDTADGAKIFGALPKELQRPELKAVMHTFADFGRTLNNIDKYKILTLLRQLTTIAGG